MAPQSTTTSGRLARARVVQRLGDTLLARSGLALDQHRRVARRDALELREQLAHARTGTDQRAERLALRGRQLDLRALDLDAHLAVAQREHGAAADRGLDDRDAAGQRLVAAAEIPDP